jgi:hypothetical protein
MVTIIKYFYYRWVLRSLARDMQSLSKAMQVSKKLNGFIDPSLVSDLRDKVYQFDTVRRKLIYVES